MSTAQIRLFLEKTCKRFHVDFKFIGGTTLEIPRFRIGLPSKKDVTPFTESGRGVMENDRRGGLRYAKVSCRIQRVCDPDRFQPDILYGTASYTFPGRAGKSGLHRLHRDGCARPLPVSLLLIEVFSAPACSIGTECPRCLSFQ